MFVQRVEPRQWQQEAADTVAARNLIVNAGTGTGKTFIGSLAINAALSRDRRKKCAFLVPTRVLATQQWRYLCRVRPADDAEQAWLLHPARVALLTGHTCSGWRPEAWQNCKQRSDVFVATYQVMHDMIVTRGMLQLDELSLIVIDECHNVRGDAPAAQLLQKLRGSGAGTRLLGLTASFAITGTKDANAFQQERNELESLLQAELRVYDEGDPKQRQATRITYTEPSQQCGSQGKELIEALCVAALRAAGQTGLSAKQQKCQRQLPLVLLELGFESFRASFEDFCKSIGVKDFTAQILQSEHWAELKKGQPEQSSKCRSLLQVLRAQAAARSGRGPRELRAIIFVKETCLTIPLATCVGKIPALQGKVAAASGISSMTEAQRNNAFAAFREGKAQVLVVTDCGLEGVDVQSCNVVIRFSGFETVRSKVQGDGRARQDNAEVYYMENDPEKEAEAEARMREVARGDGSRGEFADINSAPASCSQLEQSYLHPLRLPTSGAEVNFRNSFQLYSTYVGKISHGKESASDLLQPSGGGIVVLGPGGEHEEVSHERLQNFYGPIHAGIAEINRRAYLAVLILHVRSWLDDHNQLPRELETRRPQEQKQTSDEQQPQERSQPCVTIPEELLWTREDLKGSEGLDISVAPWGASRRPRQRWSQNLEQESLGVATLRLADIRPTQQTVRHKFSNGGKLSSALVSLVDRESRIADFPRPRIAMNPEDGQHYTADNRRIFIFKVVAPTLDVDEVEVDLVNWTSEFEVKLQQKSRYGAVWCTDDSGVQEVRERLQRFFDVGDSAWDETDYEDDDGDSSDEDERQLGDEFAKQLGILNRVTSMLTGADTDASEDDCSMALSKQEQDHEGKQDNSKNNDASPEVLPTVEPSHSTTRHQLDTFLQIGEALAMRFADRRDLRNSSEPLSALNEAVQNVVRPDGYSARPLDWKVDEAAKPMTIQAVLCGREFDKDKLDANTKKARQVATQHLSRSVISILISEWEEETRCNGDAGSASAGERHPNPESKRQRLNAYETMS